MMPKLQVQVPPPQTRFMFCIVHCGAAAICETTFWGAARAEAEKRVVAKIAAESFMIMDGLDEGLV